MFSQFLQKVFPLSLFSCVELIEYVYRKGQAKFLSELWLSSKRVSFAPAHVQNGCEG